jgi:hypothetical protein
VTLDAVLATIVASGQARFNKTQMLIEKKLITILIYQMQLNRLLTALEKTCAMPPTTWAVWIC